jgi:hypothetical protein
MAVKTKRKSVATHLSEVRSRKGKDLSPKWEGCELWDTNKFLKFFRDSMDWYRLEKSAKDLKPEVINWMSVNGYTVDEIKSFKDTDDFRCSQTVGAIAANFNRGMPAQRDDFNGGKNTEQWLRKTISEIIADGANDKLDPEETSTASKLPVPSIQERLRDAAYKMMDDIEDALELFHKDPESFDPKGFKILSSLRGRQAKAAHARVIRDFYKPNFLEIQEALEGKCEQLKEAYSHLTKKQLKKLIEFYSEVDSACEMLSQEQKVNRKPRAKKAQPKEKIVAKMKYCKANEALKLVSINPTDIIGAKELWVFNVKTRKIGKYVAQDFQDLAVKGTTVVNFSENKSVQKTLRKPEEQLKEFKAAGKVQLRKFLEDIKAVDIKLNGRINEDTILLKVS